MKKLMVLVLAVLLCGCGTQQAYIPTGDGLGVGQLTTAPVAQENRDTSLAYDPRENFNPYTCTNQTNRALFSLIYQSLFSLNGQYQAQPILCSRYRVSQDQKSYVFYLENASFSDGTAVTAADVVASLEAARAGAVYSGRLYNVTAICATADGAVEITLATGYAQLPMLLDIPIVPAKQVTADAPLGSGAYILQKTAASYQLWRRQDWWCSATLAVQAQQIPLVACISARGLRDEFELGDVALVCANPASDSYVDFRSNYDLYDCENGTFLYLGCRAKSKVFGKQTVRQALTYAIDRTALVKEQYRTFARAATLPASPGSPYYSDALAQQYGYAPEKFTAALQQEGLQDSSIVLLVNKDDSHRVKVANAIAAMLEPCGLTVTVKSLGGRDYTNALSWGNYDLHLGQTKLSPNMDLSAFFDKDGALDYGGMNDSAISALCKAALANSGNYIALHRAVLEDAMLCPVAFLSDAVYVRKGALTGLSPARDNIFCYDLEKTLKDIQMQ